MSLLEQLFLETYNKRRKDYPDEDVNKSIKYACEDAEHVYEQYKDNMIKLGYTDLIT